jgi:hypothetical protein
VLDNVGTLRYNDSYLIEKKQTGEMKMNRTKVKVWFTSGRVWFEQRDPKTNQAYFVSNTGNEITMSELFKNYTPKPFSL